MSESKTISKGLTTTFLVHFILGILLGLFIIIAPVTYAEMFDFASKEPMLLRLVGAIILTLGISSWFGYKETNLDNVKIIVRTEITWTVLAAIIFFWGMITDEFPAWAWLNALLMLAFAGAFTYFFYYADKETPAE